MKKGRDKSPKPSELRSRAEEQLNKLKAGTLIPLTEDKIQKLLHELQVHQIELEMQNEELRRAREEAETALEKYTELYDFAPAGYVTLSKDGVISEINLAGSNLLDTERSLLINKPFDLFIAVEDLPVFIAFLGKVFEGKGNGSCEVRLRREGSRIVFVYIEAKGLIEGVKCHAIVIDITKRREAEEALWKSNALNKSIIDSSSDCIKILDLEGRLQNMSQGGQRLMGILDIEKYLNLPYQEFWIGPDKQAALEAINSARQGKLGTFQGHCPTEDGKSKWWDVAITPVVGAEGKPERLLAVSRDITERRKIEDAQLFLSHSDWVASGEDFFKSLARYLAVNLGMDYVCIDRLQGERLAAQTVAVYFDDKFEDNVSYALKDTPCGDVVGKTICCFSEGVRHLFPKDVILQEIIAESYVGTTLWSSEGQPIGLIAIIGRKPLADPQLAESMLRLVSMRAAGELERRQADEALRASLERYRSYIEVTGELGWTTTANGEVVEDMPSWRMYTGQTIEEIKDQGWSRALHPDDLEHALKIWNKSVKGKSSYEVEYRIRRHDGIYRHFMVRGIPVFNEDGSIREWVGTCIDITERKKIENSLKKLNQELHFTSSELELAYKDMESFSYSISHDLRAPLRIIVGMSEILLKDYFDKLDEEGKQLLNLIRGNAKRMDQLIMALLDMSKVDKKEMRIDEIDMGKEAALIAAELKEAVPKRNISMTIKNLPHAYGDITLIRQVFKNLLSNAFKFTKDKDIALIEVGGYTRHAEYVYYVKDNGAGFDMDYADKLFKVFQRLHSLKDFEGIGIGLSIVQRIVRRHGGRVWAEGKPGEGATLYFTFPSKENSIKPQLTT